MMAINLYGLISVRGMNGFAESGLGYRRLQGYREKIRTQGKILENVRFSRDLLGNQDFAL